MFKDLCDGLLESATEEQYEIIKRKIDDFISQKDNRSFLKGELKSRFDVISYKNKSILKYLSRSYFDN